MTVREVCPSCGHSRMAHRSSGGFMESTINGVRVVSESFRCTVDDCKGYTHRYCQCDIYIGPANYQWAPMVPLPPEEPPISRAMTTWGNSRGSAPGGSSTAGQPKAAFRLSDYVLGSFLKASDLKNPRWFKVTAWDLKTFPAKNGQGEETKPYLTLSDPEGHEVDWTLNSTNAATLADKLGLQESLDPVVGQYVYLVTTKVQGPNGLTDGIRIADARSEVPEA